MIRKLVASVLITVLCAHCFYKLACVTYYQLNKDYIAAFLCENRDNPITICYGQCFLKKALGFESESNTNSISFNLKFELPVFKMNESISIDFTADFQQISLADLTVLETQSHSSSIFHPPSFAC